MMPFDSSYNYNVSGIELIYYYLISHWHNEVVWRDLKVKTLPRTLKTGKMHIKPIFHSGG